MTKSRQLPPAIVAAIRENKMLAIRAGNEHRFIGIWAVVVEGRVFVRSWSLKPRSWYRTFLEDPRGAIQVGTKQLSVRAVPTRSERLKNAISQAYLDKYNTPGSLKYARDLGSKKSREATIELTAIR
jgi:hypothetical protein